jgi:poly(A) polymerase Pap1
MEGEKYNLGKAQEEAEKLQKKVASGDAQNYGEAEKLVEQETKKKEAIASQLGLKIDSPLVGALSSLEN